MLESSTGARVSTGISNISPVSFVSVSVDTQPRNLYIYCSSNERRNVTRQAQTADVLLSTTIQDTSFRQATWRSTGYQNYQTTRESNTPYDGRESQPVQPQSVESDCFRPHNQRRRVAYGVSNTGPNVEYDDRTLVIPVFPLPIAILCCILNFLIPGLGSIVAAVCVCFCGKNDDLNFHELTLVCDQLCCVGVFQLLSTVCCFLCWIWSCMWGTEFIHTSVFHYNSVNGNNDDYNSSNNNGVTNNPVYSGRQHVPTSIPRPQVVVVQPRNEDVTHECVGTRGGPRFARSRISLPPSNLIYPMREESNIVYNEPPPLYSGPTAPPYRATASPPPAYRSAINDVPEQRIARQ